MFKKIVIMIFISSFIFANERSYLVQKNKDGNFSIKNSKKSKFFLKNKNKKKFFQTNKVENVKQNKLLRTHDENNSPVSGYWSERDTYERKYELLLDVYDSQEIPHPAQVLALEQSSGGITINAGPFGSFDVKYLDGLSRWASTAGFLIDENTNFPFFDIFFINDTSDSYVFRPDSIILVIYTEEAWYDTTGELEPVYVFASAAKVLINSGDPIIPNFEDFEESDSLIDPNDGNMNDFFRIVHGITFEDTVKFHVPDSSYILAGETLNVYGSLLHDKITLTPGEPIDIVEIFDSSQISGDIFINNFLYPGGGDFDIELFENGIGNQYLFYYDDYDYYSEEIGIYTIPFYWTDYGDYLDIRKTQTDYSWDNDLNEEIEYVYEETFRIGYQVIEDNVVQWGVTDDFCYDEYNQSYSPYQCGDNISQFLPVYGLDGVSSLLLNESRVYEKIDDLSYDYDYKMGTDIGFSSIFPIDGTTIEINEFNAWSDTLKFIWGKADHMFGVIEPGDVTYYPEVTGDLSKFFFLTGSTKETSWKFPYNQIKSNMSAAGINFAEGTWSVRAEAETMVGGTSPAIIGTDAIVNGPVITESILFFDGYQDTVLINNSNNFENSPFSMSFVISTTQTGSAGILLKSDGNGVWEEGEFHLYNENGYITFVGFDNEYIRSTTKINDGNEHNVVITSLPNSSDNDGKLKFVTSVKVYIDGQDVTSASSNYRNDDIEDSSIVNYPIMLGIANNSETFTNFEGTLIDLAIYNVSLDSSTAKGVSDGTVDTEDQALKQHMTGFWLFETVTGETKKMVSIQNNNISHKLTINATSLNVSANELIPDKYELHKNYPNPFNPSTNIKFDIPDNGIVSLIVYDLMGHKVNELVNTNMNSGFHSISWDGTDSFGNILSTGVYIYQLKAEDYSKTQKMLFIK